MSESASTSMLSGSRFRLHLPFSASAWKLALKAGIGCVLILEHSFFLHQQKIENPLATATEQYKVSGVSAKVAKALAKFYPQYKPQVEKREEMLQLLMDLISEHIISKHISK